MISVFIGNKHPSKAILNFPRFLAAVADVVMETYASLRPVEFLLHELPLQSPGDSRFHTVWNTRVGLLVGIYLPGADRQAQGWKSPL